MIDRVGQPDGGGSTFLGTSGAGCQAGTLNQTETAKLDFSAVPAGYPVAGSRMRWLWLPPS